MHHSWNELQPSKIYRQQPAVSGAPATEGDIHSYAEFLKDISDHFFYAMALREGENIQKYILQRANPNAPNADGQTPNP